MKKMTFKRSKLGFTLAELLLVIAIVAILVALGVTGFVALRQNIIIAKYDDLAREIYVAAQNQLTRMEANGLDQIALDALANGTPIPSEPSDYKDSGSNNPAWEDVKDSYRYANKINNQPMTVLLPLGTVADSVRTNGFYTIEYNVQTRTVYGVFYSDQSFEYTDVIEIADFRKNRNVRKDTTPTMVGYYGGSAVKRDPLTHLDAPKLEIINNNELRLNILNVPTDITNISVIISDGTNTTTANAEIVSGESGKRTVLLDSLEEGKHFHQLFGNLIPSRDLTVTVGFEKTGAISSSASITVNSLFATREHGTDGDVVTLAWARHLQNLEKSVSHLDDSEDDSKIIGARQTEHIQWEDTFGKFVSINNDGINENLGRFEGGNLEIRDLKGSNGLFAKTKQGMDLSGIRIVNPVINAEGNAPVGALVGTAAHKTVIHMCGVYANKLSGDQTVAYGEYRNCYVDGKNAVTGGLVGQAANTSVTFSFAALPSLKGGRGAALIGSAAGCNISNSYANCDDLDPDFMYFVSGGTEANTIDHCYAVGNAVTSTESAFAFTTDGVTDCYYAVSHRKFAEKWENNDDLAATQFCYTEGGSNWVSINQEQMQKATTDGGWATAWANMIAPLSHPYREYLNGRAFPYPAIAELDHYGSWPDGNGTVDLKIDMTLLNNQGAGYADFAGQVIVKNKDGAELFNSNSLRNADGTFNGNNIVHVTPGTEVTVIITAENGYEYIYTVIDGTRHYPTAAEPAAEKYEVKYTVNKDTEAVVTFRQKAFELTGIPAVNEDGSTHIEGSSYGIDLTSPIKTLNITNSNQTEKVETGSKVTVRPKVPDAYVASVVWYETAGNNGEKKRTYLTRGTDDSYTFNMPAEPTEVHVMYTTKEANFNIEYYLMDTDGHYPATPTQTANYDCGLGSQINQSMINAFAESSGLPLTIDGERVRYLAHAVVYSNLNENASDLVFESEINANGGVTQKVGPHISEEHENKYLVKIYIDRKQYTVTLTADTHVSGVRFGDTGDFQRAVTAEFYYGATVTAQADVATGYHFAYWDPQDDRFMMSADASYTFNVPQFDLHLKASAATDSYLVTVNLLKDDESWLYSDPSRQADQITLTLVNSIDETKTYTMKVLTEDTISYAMQAVVPSVSEYGAGYYVRVNYASGLQSWIYTSGTQGGTDEQNDKLLIQVRDNAVERTAKFYSVTYHPNMQSCVGTVPKGGVYPMYYHLTVEGNSGLLRNSADDGTYFCGWKDYYAEGTGSDVIYGGGEVLMLTRRTDMFAEWNKSLRVVYDGNGADGGELPVDLNTYQNGGNVTVKFGSLTRKGYRFLGWSTDQQAADAKYTEAGTKTFAISGKSVTLYAVWEHEQYNVLFCDTNGNSLEDTKYNFLGKHYGYKIENVPTYTPQDGQFIGWSLTKGGEIVCRAGEEYTVTGDAKLYACVAAKLVTVTYKSGDDTTIIYDTVQFGMGIPAYLNCIPEINDKATPVTAWSTLPKGKGTLYFCDESGRSEKAFAFTENTTLYAVYGKVYNYNVQLWFDTLYDAVTDKNTQDGHTLIVYRDTVESYRIVFNKNLYVLASGNRTVKWKDGATNGSGEKMKEEKPQTHIEKQWDNISKKDVDVIVTDDAKEFVGCMYVYDNGYAVTVKFGESDVPTLSMVSSTLTFDANQQSRGIALGSGATFHMYDGVTITNGKRDTGNTTDIYHGGNAHDVYKRSYYGGGVYAGDGSVFYMHGGTVSFCEAVSGGGVYLLGSIKDLTGSRMYMGDMVRSTAFSTTAIYYTMAHDDKLDEDIYINADGVTQENFKQFYVTAGDPKICYNTSTQSAYGDGGGGLLMFDLKNGDLILYRGSITNNRTTGNGGGIVTDSGPASYQPAANSSKLRIYEVDVSHNTSSCRGGGIYQWQGTVYVYNSTIRQNKAQDGGGAFLMANGSVSNIEFYFGDISDNVATGNGGGVFAYNGADFIMKGGNLCRNTAKNGGGAYMQMSSSIRYVTPPKYAHPSTLDLEAGYISGNTASVNGGGIYCTGAVNMSHAANDMTGAILSGNKAGNFGGGVYIGKQTVQTGTDAYNNPIYTTYIGSMTMSAGTVCNNEARYLGGGVMVGGQFDLSGGSLYGNTDTDYESNIADEDNVNQAPNDIYLMGDLKINIPDGGIALSGEERVAIDCERDESLRFKEKDTLPYRFAVYENARDFKSNDALYFTYFGTRSSDASIASGKKNLTVVTHQELLGNYATGLYLNEETAGTDKYSYVIFELNYPNAPVIDSQLRKVGEVLNLNDSSVLPQITRSGYYLAGWARTADAVEEQYVLFYDVVENVWKSNFKDGNWQTLSNVPQYTVQDLAKQTLYAMWRPCVVVYNVGEAAEANGAKIQPIGIGPHVTILNPSPMEFTVGDKTYYFKHWVDEKNGIYKPMQQVDLTENLRLNAVWEERLKDNFIITFYFNDGTSDKTGELCRDVSVKKGGSYKIDVDIHRANKILVGWTTDPNGTETNYAVDGTVSNLEKDLNLYAVWADAVTLTYNVNGGSGTGTVISIVQGSTVEIKMDDLTREGYLFQGWADTPDATTAQYHKGGTFGPVNLNTTLYAVWAKDPKAKFQSISFDLSGGTGDGFKTVEILDGKTFRLPAEIPVKEGRIFRGWSTGTHETLIQPDSTVTVTSDIAFTAVWAYTVTFDLDGVTCDGLEDVYYVPENGDFNIPNAVPTKDGFIFKGWSLTKGAANVNYKPNETITVQKDTTLYAVWAEAVTITFNLNYYGADPQSIVRVIEKGSIYTIDIKNPVRDGYKFVGWRKNKGYPYSQSWSYGDSYDTVNEDITLYAYWHRY